VQCISARTDLYGGQLAIAVTYRDRGRHLVCTILWLVNVPPVLILSLFFSRSLFPAILEPFTRKARSGYEWI